MRLKLKANNIAKMLLFVEKQNTDQIMHYSLIKVGAQNEALIQSNLTQI